MNEPTDPDVEFGVQDRTIQNVRTTPEKSVR